MEGHGYVLVWEATCSTYRTKPSSCDFSGKREA